MYSRTHPNLTYPSPKKSDDLMVFLFLFNISAAHRQSNHQCQGRQWRELHAPRGPILLFTKLAITPVTLFEMQLFKDHTIRDNKSSNARYQCQHGNHRNGETHVVMLRLEIYNSEL
jgi:hypothetical protein